MQRTQHVKPGQRPHARRIESHGIYACNASVSSSPFMNPGKKMTAPPFLGLTSTLTRLGNAQQRETAVL